MTPIQLTLKANSTCVHRTLKTITIKETVLNRAFKVLTRPAPQPLPTPQPPAKTQCRDRRQKCPPPLLSLKEDYLHVLKGAACRPAFYFSTYLCTNYILPEKSRRFGSCHLYILFLAHSMSLMLPWNELVHSSAVWGFVAASQGITPFDWLAMVDGRACVSGSHRTVTKKHS